MTIFKDEIKRKIWERLGTNSRKALRKTKKKWGHPKVYKPKSDLVKNLSYELNLPELDICLQLEEMRQEIIKLDTIGFR